MNNERDQEKQILEPYLPNIKSYMAASGLAIAHQYLNLRTNTPRPSATNIMLASIMGTCQGRIHADNAEKFILYTSHPQTTIPQKSRPTAILLHLGMLLSSGIMAYSNPNNLRLIFNTQGALLQYISVASDIGFHYFQMSMLHDYLSSQWHQLLPRETLSPSLLIGIGGTTLLSLANDIQQAPSILSPSVPINILFSTANSYCCYRALSDKPLNQNPHRNNSAMFSNTMSKIFALLSTVLMIHTLATIFGYDSRTTWLKTFTAITQLALGGAFKKATPSYFFQPAHAAHAAQRIVQWPAPLAPAPPAPKLSKEKSQ